MLFYTVHYTVLHCYGLCDFGHFGDVDGIGMGSQSLYALA